jgi:hypothetical protein
MVSVDEYGGHIVVVVLTNGLHHFCGSRGDDVPRWSANISSGQSVCDFESIRLNAYYAKEFVVGYFQL